MKRGHLDDRQRDSLADFFIKLSYMAAAALIFGQLVPGKEPQLEVIIGGAIIVTTLIIFGIKLRKQNQ